MGFVGSGGHVVSKSRSGRRLVADLFGRHIAGQISISLEVECRKKSSTIYAGTSWRPYKSTDSGKNWRLIKTGMIDDSDIFAITVNPKDHDHLIASACSGIYESLNGGDQWAKINGIPSTSRRTRAIIQHPSVPGTIFAGTTEGFWLSTIGGKSWSLTTQRNLEINSIAVHPDEPIAFILPPTFTV
jgi:hypothetical protein